MINKEHKGRLFSFLFGQEEKVETMQMFKEEGREEGEDKLGQLIGQLPEAGRISDAQRAAADKEARAALYKEFGIA